MSASCLSRPPLSAPPLDSAPSPAAGERSVLAIVDRAHPRRAAVEAFIQDVYAARYGARVREFMPTLVATLDADGGLLAAAGYRGAGAQALFLERYLARPVEQLLAPDARRAPARERIVEVGHLAAAQAGQGRRLVLQLGPHLANEGFEWVVSTLTEELRQLFARLGLASVALGIADPTLLGPQAADWGRYYEHRPLVLAGQIATALPVLARRRSAA